MFLVVWVKIYRLIGLETISCSTVAGAPSDTPRQDERILVRDDQQVGCPVVIMNHHEKNSGIAIKVIIMIVFVVLLQSHVHGFYMYWYLFITYRLV